MYHSKKRMSHSITSCLLVLLMMSLIVLVGCSSGVENDPGSASVQGEDTGAASEDTETGTGEVSLVDQLLAAQPDDQFKPIGAEPAPSEKKSIKVGLVPPVSVLYHETVKKGVEEAIDSLPEGYEIELLYQMPTSSGQAATTEQINIIETWVNQGVDAIIMCPVADDAMFEPIFKKAAEEGISVFEYGVDLSMVINQYYTSCIIYSQYDSAKAVGAWVAENYADKDLKIAMVAGPKGPYSEIREQGFKDGLASQGSHEFVASQSGDWLREKAVNVTENMLNANPDINLVYCMYDEMAMGAASAVANMDLQDKVDIVGYDMNIESLQALKAGTIKCSVYNGTKEAGQDCIKAIKQFVMDGKEINKLYLYPPKVVSYQDADQFDENLLILE